MIAKLRILFGAGIVLLLVPFFGVRSPLRMIITVLIGLLVMWLSLRIGREYVRLRHALLRSSEE